MSSSQHFGGTNPSTINNITNSVTPIHNHLPTGSLNMKKDGYNSNNGLNYNYNNLNNASAAVSNNIHQNFALEMNNFQYKEKFSTIKTIARFRPLNQM
jgi:hypothetical protein